MAEEVIDANVGSFNIAFIDTLKRQREIGEHPRGVGSKYCRIM